MSHSQMENQFCNSIAVFAPLSPIANRDFDKTLDAQLQFNFAFLFLNNSGYYQTWFTFLYLSIPYHFSRHYNSGEKKDLYYIYEIIIFYFQLLDYIELSEQIQSNMKLLDAPFSISSSTKIKSFIHSHVQQSEISNWKVSKWLQKLSLFLFVVRL